MGKKEEIPFWRRYWWVFIGAIGGISLASALSFTSADGWIEITNLGNDSYDLGWNTTKPTVCTVGNYSYWNGSAFLCSPATTGGGSFNYATYFDQTLNKSSDVEFNSVKAHTSAGLVINASNGLAVVDLGLGNTNNSNFYGSVTFQSNICLGGVCRGSWPNNTGNITGTANSSADYVAVFSNSTNIQQAKLRIDTNGNAFITRDLRLSNVDGGDSAFYFNGTGDYALYFLNSGRTRWDGGGSLMEFHNINNRIYFTGSGNPTMDLYDDSTDRTFVIENAGSQGANLDVDNNITAQNLNVSTGYADAASICLNGDCRTSWPSGGSTTIDYEIRNRTAQKTDQAVTNASFTLFSNLGKTVPNGYNFTIECTISYITGSTAEGFRPRINITGTSERRISMVVQTSTTGQQFYGSTTATSVASTATNGIGTTTGQSKILVVGQSNAQANFTFEASSETGTGSTVYKGSFCELYY